MSEVAEYGEPEADESSLVAWAREASAAHTIATSLVKTSFVPAAMRDKAAEATAAILTGREVGMKPMASLRSINVIQGVPAMTAIALRGLVQSAGHEVWVVEQTEAKAVVAGQRKGSEHVQKSTWTMGRAQRLGLADKTNWQKQPEAMLVARATAEVCRLVAADVLMGLPYAVEELDVDDAPARRTAKRKTPEPAPPSDEPDLDEPAVSEVSPDQVAIGPVEEPEL